MEYIKNCLFNIYESFKINPLIVLGIFIGFILLAPVVAYILVKILNIKKSGKEIKENGLYRPLKLFIILLGLYISSQFINFPIGTLVIINKIFKICIIALAAKGLANLCDLTAKGHEKLKQKFNFNGSDSVLKFIAKASKIVIYIFAGFMIVSEFGYNLGGLVTGLGLGSVVVALASQDLAKNIIGGLSIMLDRPFSLGDYVIINDYEGTVEQITFRSTRIRDLSKQIIVIPNGEISNGTVTNCSKRETRYFKTTLVLELSTPLEKIKTFEEKLEKMLLENPNVIKENIRISFTNISDNGYDIFIAFYTDAFIYNDYLKFKEEMNYMIMNLLQSENIDLAYNSQTIYLKQ